MILKTNKKEEPPMLTGSLPSVLFSLMIGLILLQVVLFLYAVFKKKNGFLVLLLFTLFLSIVTSIGLGIWAIVDDAFENKERTAEEQALYNQEVADTIVVSDFGADEWETIMRATGGDYTAIYPILVQVSADDPEMLEKVEAYGDVLEVKGLLTEIAELRAAPISYLIKYDGQLERELSKTATHYREIVSNLENIDIAQEPNYQALYGATNEVLASLQDTNGEDVFTVIEQELGNIHELDLESATVLYEKYKHLLTSGSETVLANEEKINDYFQTITTDFEKDITEYLEGQ